MSLHRPTATLTAALAASTAAGALLAVTAAPSVGSEDYPVWSRADPVGDAPPAADLTRAETHWGREHRVLFARVRVRDLRATGSVRVSLVTDGGTFHLVATRRAGSESVRLEQVSVEGEHYRSACGGLAMSWDAAADEVAVSAPIGRCVDRGHPSAWGTTGVRLTGPRGGVDTAGSILETGD